LASEVRILPPPCAGIGSAVRVDGVEKLDKPFEFFKEKENGDGLFYV
jgi:hypothetical protein